MAEVMRKHGDEVLAGTFEIECSECGARLPCEVYAKAGTDEDGDPAIFTRSDLSEVWAHSWVHEAEEEADGQ